MSYSASEFYEHLSTDVKYVESLLTGYLPKKLDVFCDITEAMEYSVLAGGKRLRPIIMLETYRMLGKEDSETVKAFAVALEFIHSYSLVHDDLPAMDNDMLRRGLPTTHAKFGEAMGILAGDALLNYAFEIVAKAIAESDDPKLAAQAMIILGENAGYKGMIGGQVLDLEAEKRSEISADDLFDIHRLKTGKLLQSSFMIGAKLAGASEDVVSDMEALGLALGMAFQIQDDILDVIGDETTLGKPIGSDAENGKITCITVWGLEGAREKVEEYTNLALNLIDKYSEGESFLKDLIVSLVDRES